MSFSSSVGYIPKRAPRKQTFTVSVCGASGTGKSAFINTFIGRKVSFDSMSDTIPSYQQKSHFEPTSVELDGQLSDGSRLVSNMIETEGFGQASNHESDVAAVAHFIEHRFDEVLAEESRIRRNPRFKDNRVDVCIYFIEPTSHGSRELDVSTMKRSGSIVNVIPVIARADTLTPAESASNKRSINEDIQFYDLELFNFQFTEESGPNEVTEDSELTAMSPFAITSTSEYDKDGSSLYLRKSAYGTVQILDPKQSEFKVSRDALIDEFLIELKDRTHLVSYETFRTQRLDPKAQHRTSILMPQQLADHAARLKQAQIDRETALSREQERRVNAEIEAKRASSAKREMELRQLDIKMAERRVSSGSQPSSAHSARFPTNQIPNVPDNYSSPRSMQTCEQSDYSSAPLNSSEFPSAATYKPPPPAPQSVLGDSSIADDSNVDFREQRIRQSRSKQELRAHADQSHMELGNLEAQKQDIQRQVASATSMKSMHAQLNPKPPVPASAAPQANTRVSSDSSNEPIEQGDLQSNTSPLNIKKMAQA